MIYKTLQEKLTIEQHESHKIPAVNSCAPEVQHCPAPQMAPIV